MKRVVLWGAACVFLLILGGMAFWAVSAALRDPDEQVGINPAKVAEHLHAVIEANRTVYATYVVEKLQAKGIVEAAEHWKQEVALPLPAQFLIETGRLAAERGSGVKYRLVSLWPIYVWNAPSTDFERKGLEMVNKDPDHPYTGFVKNERNRFFQAIYADVAISQACIDCHNSHPNSPRRDFKLKDVMGGIVITIPIESK
jgi:Protein of unknown function (DUF3365)